MKTFQFLEVRAEELIIGDWIVVPNTKMNSPAAVKILDIESFSKTRRFGFEGGAYFYAIEEEMVESFVDLEQR